MMMDEICRTCNRPHGDGYTPRHPFKNADGTLKTSQSDEPPAAHGALRVPFDPVLRLALIRRGVITPEDLATAEAEIRVTSAAFGEAMRGDGESSDVPGRSAVSG